MIDEPLFQTYLSALLAGRHGDCRSMVQGLIEKHIDLKDLYTNLFQRSLYTVGELWENNKITVAREHLTTSITESLLNLVYPSMFATERIGKKTVISCSANEFHQLGGKMVADIFELNGWDGFFLGANTPPDDLSAFIQETQPDVVGLPVGLYPRNPTGCGGIIPESSLQRRQFEKKHRNHPNRLSPLKYLGRRAGLPVGRD
jgi:MerR family transcriptional regulator, light-induced transcriptional regulator